MFKEDCAICFRLLETQEHLLSICGFIKLSCGKSKLVDFGLHYSLVDSILGEVRKAQGYHSEYHMREDRNPAALKPPKFGVNSGKSFRPRYRKQIGNNDQSSS